MSEVEIMVLILALEGLLFVVLGAAMPGMQPSRWVGIRYHATMSDDRVWHETHRRSGRRFALVGWTILGGGILLVALPLPGWVTLGAFTALAVSAMGWFVLDSWRFANARLAHYREVDAALHVSLEAAGHEDEPEGAERRRE